MQYHRKGQGVPLLVAATTRMSQMLGTSVAPRLNSTKKLRSSRRYFPSSPNTHALAGGNINVGDDEEDDEIRNMDICDDMGIHHAIRGVQENVWSGRHHWAAEDEDSENEGDEDLTDSEDGKGCDADREEYWDDGGSDDNVFLGLSAREKLGENFARDAIANGKFSHSISIPSHLLTDCL